MLDDWNPKYDPIYDPQIKLCHFERDPGYQFTPERYLMIIGAVNESDSSPTKGFLYLSLTNELDSSPTNSDLKTGTLRFSPPAAWDSDDEFKAIEEYKSPSTPSPNKSSTALASTDSPAAAAVAASEDILYVPEMCKGFERKWDFIVGDLFGEERKVIGWISRIGFSDYFIRRMGFPLQSASYTLLPHFLSKRDSSSTEPISGCNFVEIECDGEKLLHNLKSISCKIDSYYFRSLIVAVTITFDKYGMASIKIIMKPVHADYVCRELSQVHCGIII